MITHKSWSSYDSKAGWQSVMLYLYCNCFLKSPGGESMNSLATSTTSAGSFRPCAMASPDQTFLLWKLVYM